MEIKTAAVSGTGMMGPGIAAVLALSGRNVTLVSRNIDTARAGVRKSRDLLSVLAENGLVRAHDAEAAASRIGPADDPQEAVAGAQLFVESILEDLALKQRYFQKLDEASPDAILCSNTSGISITRIAARCSRPQRVFTTHFWNPPHLMPLVEVVMGEKSDEAIARRLLALLRDCGKVPVLVRKDVPGQLGNRIQHAMIRECMNIVAQGIATAEDVDLAVKAGFGLRAPVYGVFEHADMVGLDLVKAVQDCVLPDLNTQPSALPIHNQKIEAGELGVKSGKGFLDWPEGKAERVRRRRDLFILEFLRLQKAGRFD